MGSLKWSIGLLNVILVGTLVMSGCSQQKSADSDGKDSSQSTITVASMSKYAPNKVPNLYVEEVEKRFHMDWDYQAIPLSAGVEKYNVMFASGDYPDFIPNMNNPTSVTKWANSGFLLPISDYMDQLPNYRKLFTDDEWNMMLDFSTVHGKLYYLPNKVVSDPKTWIYRKDSFDKAGITTFPKTLDGLYEALKKLKKQYPESVGIGVRGGTGNGGIVNLMDGFRQAFRNPASPENGFWQDPDMNNEVVYSLATDKQRNMLSFLAKLYKEGLIEPEFATLTEDQWKAKRLTGKVLIDFQWSSHTVDPNYALNDIPGGQWEYSRFLPSASPDQPALEFKPMSFASFGPVFSSKLADEPEKRNSLFQYVEWSATEEGQLFHTMGLEGVTYEKTADGNIQYKDGLNRKKVAEQYGFDYILKQSDAALAGDPLFLKKQEAMKNMSDVYNVTPRSVHLTAEEEQTMNTLVTALKDVAYQFATKAVMGIVDVSSDKVWTDYLSDLEKVGLSQALDIYKKYWK
ncbi:putative aldouronate transport system substrate-binding protein [Paenibacillus rhizosphaerae]|uniref:Putative aldouronate transport system substrate-binding protein n=1 Tax=Paenibacillus rhizosphaerae TaxID=297318 RepID=A0A839TSL6_9BACL|nr:extracellular solute-binding protein [Paenibacillus rhizosphaerae]MBB3128289.1 putative aldouronate transport system substrate-binding protein [Paenibacillus rhizosphaerae]